MGSFTDSNRKKKRVWGGQGSPQEPNQQYGPAVTPGSSMNRCFDAQAASKSMSCRSIFRGAASWVALFAAMAVFGLASVSLHAESANTFFKRGQAAETREDFDAAVDNYQKALAKAPNFEEYRAALYRVRITASAIHVTNGYKLLNAGKQQESLVEFLHAAEIDPGNEAAQQAIATVRNKLGQLSPATDTRLPEPEGRQEELGSMGSPAVLKPVSNEPLTLHMTEDSKVIYQAVGKAAGVNVLFDPDYTSKRIQVDLNNVTLVDALRIVGTISNTFWRPVTDNTIFVAANTKSKRTELDEQAVETFYLSNAWQPNDLTDVQTAIRNVLTNVKIYAVPSQNAIVMRATPDELLLAQKLVNDLDKPRPEVLVDIAILEVSKNWERTLGIAWPTNVGVALQSPNSTSTSTTTGTTTTGSTSSSVSPTLYDLSHLKATDFAVTVGGATANLLLTDSRTKILQNPRIRATDAQKATMKIGSKIPVATGSYQSGAGVAAISGLVNTQFQYQDIGVNIEMTPSVHYDRDVTLKIKIEVTTHSGDQTISGVTEPIISQRVVDQVIRLREGEATILGGIDEKDITESWNGIPGLSSIPFLRYLFGSKDHTITDDELVFLIVPHVVRSQSIEPVNLREVDTGVGTSIDIRHVSSDGPPSSPVSTPPPSRPTVNTRPGVGVVPGQSAMNAAPAAINQMRQNAETMGSPQPASPPPVPAPVQTPAATTPAPAPARAQSVTLALNPPSGPQAVGATFRVPVVLSGGTDIGSVPLKITYDPAKLSLVNVDQGDFLDRDGKPPALLHVDDGAGLITINNSRPPGAPGMSGAGVVCVLSFQGKAAGDSVVAISGSGVTTSGMQPVAATPAQITVQVR
ncbi:MAG: cohesin domain-containing protein [Terracidiphilus sp.]|jgi:general secretion pathway protein D